MPVPPSPKPPPADLWPPSAPDWSLSGDAAPEPTSEVSAGGNDRYTLGNILGEGGMGRVRVAHDHLLGRDVAWKELSPRAPSRDGRRLAREAALTAQLDHPGIVAVHDAGQQQDGSPFYTMRLVRGRTLSRAMNEAAGIDGRMRLIRHFLAACEAVAAAHEAGVLHRDIKPDNILVGRFGETQVIDWGLARREDEYTPTENNPAPTEARLTAVGAIIGTPAYMAPEQARGEPATQRSDVWSLGAVLHELVHGNPPYGDISSDAVLSAARAGPPPRSRTVGANPELLAIVDRALSWSPQDRYPHAGALAEDLSRWFEGRRVEAYAYRTWDLLLRLVRAWRGPLLVGALALLLLGLSALIYWKRDRDQLMRVSTAEAESREAARQSEHALARALVSQSRLALARDDRARAEVLAVSALIKEDTPEARGVLAAYSASERPRLIERVPAPACQWAALNTNGQALLCGDDEGTALWEISPRKRYWKNPFVSRSGNFGDDDQIVLQRFGEDKVIVVDGSSGRTLRTHDEIWSELPPRIVNGVVHAYSTGFTYIWPPNKQAVEIPIACHGKVSTTSMSASGAQEMSICADGSVFMGPTGRPTRRVAQSRLDLTNVATRAVWTPDEQAIVIGTHIGDLFVLDKNGATRLQASAGLGFIKTIAVSPDSSTAIASGDSGAVLKVLNLRTGSFSANLPGSLPLALSFPSSDLVRIVDQQIETWQLPRNQMSTRLPTQDGISEVSISPDQTHIAASTGGGHLRVFNLVEGIFDADIDFSKAVTMTVAFSPDGQHIATYTMEEDSVVLIDTATWAQTRLKTPLALHQLAWRDDNTLIGVPYWFGLYEWALPLGTFTSHPAPVHFAEIAIAPEGRGALLRDVQGTIWRMDDRGAFTQVVLDTGPYVSVDFGKDGSLALGTRREALLLDPTGQVTRRIPASGDLNKLALSPDGTKLATGGLNGVTRLWSLTDGALLAVLPGHDTRISSIRFAHDGSFLVTGSWDHSARIWDLTRLSASPQSLYDEIIPAWGMDLDAAIGGN